MQGACPVDLPRLPEWYRKLNYSELKPAVVAEKVSAKVKVGSANLGLVARVCGGASALFLFALVVVLMVQFAGLVEVQYQLNRSEAELAGLRQQEARLQLQVEELSSLGRVEHEARRLGMVFPTKVQVLAPVNVAQYAQRQDLACTR